MERITIIHILGGKWRCGGCWGCGWGWGGSLTAKWGRPSESTPPPILISPWKESLLFTYWEENEDAEAVEVVVEVEGEVWQPSEADQEPAPGDQADQQQQVEDVAAGQLTRITWAPLLDPWPAACGDTSPSSCPTPPGPTATSSCWPPTCSERTRSAQPSVRGLYFVL